MSERQVYDKLVRDRIPEIIEAEGRRCGTEIMDNADFRQALLAKLIEEAQEIAASDGRDLMIEIADLLEVVDAIIATFELDRQDILITQAQRRHARGGFAKRIKLLWTE